MKKNRFLQAASVLWALAVVGAAFGPVTQASYAAMGRSSGSVLDIAKWDVRATFSTIEPPAPVIPSLAGQATASGTTAGNDTLVVTSANKGWYAINLWGGGGGLGTTYNSVPGNPATRGNAGLGGRVKAIVWLDPGTYYLGAGAAGGLITGGSPGGGSGYSGTNYQGGGGGGYSYISKTLDTGNTGGGTPTERQGALVAIAGGGGGGAGLYYDGSANFNFHGQGTVGGNGGTVAVADLPAPGGGGTAGAGVATSAGGDTTGGAGGACSFYHFYCASQSWPLPAVGASGSGAALVGGNVFNSTGIDQGPDAGGGGGGYFGGGAGGCYWLAATYQHAPGAGGGGSSWLAEGSPVEHSSTVVPGAFADAFFDAVAGAAVDSLMTSTAGQGGGVCQAVYLGRNNPAESPPVPGTGPLLLFFDTGGEYTCEVTLENHSDVAARFFLVRTVTSGDAPHLTATVRSDYTAAYPGGYSSANGIVVPWGEQVVLRVTLALNEDAFGGVFDGFQLDVKAVQVN